MILSRQEYYDLFHERVEETVASLCNGEGVWLTVQFISNELTPIMIQDFDDKNVELSLVLTTDRSQKHNEFLRVHKT